MDMKEMSRNMYVNIPYGGWMFTTDKITLRLETEKLNMIKAKRWFKGTPVNIVIYGNTAHINVHAEFQSYQKHLGRRCFNAVILLLLDGVFNANFSYILDNMITSLFPYIFLYDYLTKYFILSFFTLVDWENAIDFLDIAPFVFINTDSNNPKSLRKKGTGFYSRDWKQTRRTKKKNNEIFSEIKSVQKSLLCCYDKAILIDSERPIFRVETKSQGKYRKYLDIDLLDGTSEDAFEKMLPAIKTSLNKVVESSTLVLSKQWKNNPPEQYRKLFIDNE
jgi:hypothetical protein